MLLPTTVPARWRTTLTPSSPSCRRTGWHHTHPAYSVTHQYCCGLTGGFKTRQCSVGLFKYPQILLQRFKKTITLAPSPDAGSLPGLLMIMKPISVRDCDHMYSLSLFLASTFIVCVCNTPHESNYAFMLSCLSAQGTSSTGAQDIQLDSIPIPDRAPGRSGWLGKN